MKKFEFTGKLLEQKQKTDKRSAIINDRVEAIRKNIWRTEYFKWICVENYLLDAYAINTLPPVRLLKKYGLLDCYNTDQYSDNFLTRKNVDKDFEFI